MVRVLAASLMVLFGYVTIAIVIGAARDSNINWVAMVGIWSSAALSARIQEVVEDMPVTLCLRGGIPGFNA